MFKALKYKLLLLNLFFLFFTKTYVNLLTYLDSWRLNQPIGAVLRFENGGTYFSSADTFLGISSLYFPLNIFITHCSYLISENYFTYLVIFFLTLLICSIAYLLSRVTASLGGDKYSSFLICIFYFVFVLKNWFFSISDILVLFFACLLYLIIFQLLNQSYKLKNIFFLFLILFVGTFSKQQFITFNLSVVMLILINKNILNKIKIILFSICSSATFLSVFILFSIENLTYITIEIMRGHELYGWKTFLSLILDSLLRYWAIILPVFIFLFERRKKLALLNRRLVNYLLFIFPFFCLSVISAMKKGGGLTNIEISLILLLPVLCLFLEKIKDYMKPKKEIVYLIILITCLVCIIDIGRSFSEFKKISINNTQVINYLKNNFSKAKTLYTSSVYSHIYKAGLNPITDLYIVSHVSSANKPINWFYDNLKNNYYDLIYLNKNYAKVPKLDQFLNSHYVMYNKKDMPLSLEGKLWIIKRK